MKKWLFLLCSLSYGFLMAQDCTSHALMQKGAQLEYRQYWTIGGGNSAKSRLLFDVEQVKDSAGSTWSTVTKRGFGIFDPKDHYERKIVLQCDGKNLLFPYDFYSCDTLFTGDAYSRKPVDDKFGYAKAYTPLENATTYIVPLKLECIVGLPEGKKRFEQKAKRGYTPFVICKSMSDGYFVEINSIKLEGKKMVTTPAGTFTCYKFFVEEATPDFTYEYWLYFNSEVGLVKYEHVNFYIELTSIRK